MAFDSHMLLIGLGMCFASICGFNLWGLVGKCRRSRRHRESLRDFNASPEDGSPASEHRPKRKPIDRTIGYMCRLSRSLSFSNKAAIVRKGALTSKWFGKNIRYTGLEGQISEQAYAEAKCRLLALGAAAGFAMGLAFSPQMAFVLALLGAAVGWQMPQRALRSRIGSRIHEAERHLPEMLDVVALGMRSGLSFDSSLRLYSEHFDTELSNELALAQRKWASGLMRRDEALRQLAQTYKSATLGRVVETIVRSIRYGSSMVSSLEEDAADARGAYQSERQERVAKAPVKMMIPTGVLILPAMLIMVLGPVLLELAGGGL